MSNKIYLKIVRKRDQWRNDLNTEFAMRFWV